MQFQEWLFVLLLDAVGYNKAHLVAGLGPHTLWEFFGQGIAPSAQEIIRRSEGKAPPRSEKGVDGQSNQRTMARAM